MFNLLQVEFAQSLRDSGKKVFGYFFAGGTCRHRDPMPAIFPWNTVFTGCQNEFSLLYYAGWFSRQIALSNG